MTREEVTHTLVNHTLHPLLDKTTEVDASWALRNRSSSLAGNTLHMLKDKSTLTFNAGYNYQHDRMTMQSQSIYSLPEGDILQVWEEDAKRGVQHTAWLSTQWERNGAHHYMSEQLSAEGDFMDAHEALFVQERLGQQVVNCNYHLTNRRTLSQLLFRCRSAVPHPPLRDRVVLSQSYQRA